MVPRRGRSKLSLPRERRLEAPLATSRVWVPWTWQPSTTELLERLVKLRCARGASKH